MKTEARFLALSTLTLLAATTLGCAEHAATPPAAPAPPAGEVDINAPGVHVEVGGGKGVEVEAPGADVEVPAK
jgi:hypothetical protein